MNFSEKKLIGFISSLLASQELKSQLYPEAAKLARPAKLHLPSMHVLSKWGEDPAEETWTPSSAAEKW